MRNPLVKRIPKELAADWHKYAVIILFMVLMIGVISGMYVGHDSMLYSIEKGRTDLNLEDGSFELSHEASPELLAALSTGEKADVRQYFIDEGMEEADAEVADAIEEELNNQVAAGIEDAVREQCEAYGITDEEMIQAQIDTAMEENFEDALEEARNSDEFAEVVEEAYAEAAKAGTDKCFIIGGASVYRAALPDMDRLYITHVHTEVKDADTFFPAIDPAVWTRISTSETHTDPETGFEFEFSVYERA